MATPQQDGQELVEASNGDPNTLKCWIYRVLSYSSQYNDGGWSAREVIGQPKVYPRYGDSIGSWAQGNRSADEWIEVQFPVSLYLQEINIYETFNCGGITKVSAYNEETRSYVTVYEGAPSHITTSRIFSPPVRENAIDFPCNQLRIELDCTVCNSWCEIDAISIVGKKHKLPAAPSNTLCSDLQRLLDEPIFSDVCFLVEGKKIHAHKAILATRCEYFQAMFKSNMDECNKAQIPMEGIAYDTFMALLGFIYTGAISCEPAVTVELLKLADMFRLESLKTLCELRIPNLLTDGNVLSILDSIADVESLASIRAICYEFIATNFHKICLTDSFRTLPRENMLDIVTSVAPKLSPKKT
eukprot:Em0020g817a